MHLEDVIAKVRDQETWKSYIVSSSCNPRKVLGGCILREHENFDYPSGTPYVELSLLAVSSESQASGLGQRLVSKLKN